MTGLPPLDLHAHVDTSIDAADLYHLRAVVFAVTRSLKEAQTAVLRQDRGAVWGLGCHPALASSHHSFNPETFSGLLERFAFVGEVGLDGRTRVPLDRQRRTLRHVLQLLAVSPRPVSLHSAGATGAVVDELEATPPSGAILHWWLGNETQTARAIDLGCYFSVNAVGVVGHRRILHNIPLNRLLTETDHPYGDRRTRPQRPGNVIAVEEAIANHHGISMAQTRRVMWSNFRRLIQQTEAGPLMPNSIRTLIASVP